MNKNYSESVNGKTQARQAPVIATVCVEETAVNYPMADWLGRQKVVGEKGIVFKRIGGIALAAVGVPVGIFGLLCFPGLFFWMLSPLGLAMIGQGILLCFSKRAKKPEDAFKKLFGEVLFNIDGGTVNFSPYFFKSGDSMKSRIKTLYPIDGLPVDERYVQDFIQRLGALIEQMFSTYGTIVSQEGKTLSYGASFDSDVKVISQVNNITTVGGTINVIRASSFGEREIAEMRVVTHLLNIDGYFVPINPLPSLTFGNPLPYPPEAIPSTPSPALSA
jgi:hypothetical protein